MLPWVLLSVFYRVSSWRWRSKKEIGSSSVECWMVVVEEKQANIPPVKWVLVRVYVWARVERDLRQITTTEKSAPISSVIVLLKWWCSCNCALLAAPGSVLQSLCHPPSTSSSVSPLSLGLVVVVQCSSRSSDRLPIGSTVVVVWANKDVHLNNPILQATTSESESSSIYSATVTREATTRVQRQIQAMGMHLLCSVWWCLSLW